MSLFALKVKRFYDMGLYTAEMVLNFYKKGRITAEEFEAITGESVDA